MTQSLGRFRAALLLGWVVLAAAGIFLARAKGIPNWVVLPVLAAFLIEYPFYLLTGFAALREQLAGRWLAPLIAGSMILPYLVSCWGTGQFSWTGLARLAALAFTFALWYVVLPATRLTDIGFLAVIAAVLTGHYLDTVYHAPYRGADTVVLGHLGLLHAAVLVLLLERRLPSFGYTFLPSLRDWRIGALHFLYFLPLGFPLAVGMKLMHLTTPAPLWKTAALFLGFLWVVTLSEEFFFRGVLQHWLEEWMASERAAWIATSLLFGLVHLGFRGFPNWRWVILATVLGLFCGRARREAGGIGASMVTHALVIASWRGFFA